MDFVGGFPVTRRGHDYFFVVVDCFNKMCVLIPYNKTIYERETIELFFNHVWVYFESPISIISDRDNGFLGIFWTTLWERMDTKLKYSTAFHPQTDRQTEVFNRTLVQLLRDTIGNIQRLGTSN